MDDGSCILAGFAALPVPRLDLRRRWQSLPLLALLVALASG
ncbi:MULTISPECIES: hypothetical protein [unclassified Pseudofrankia]|nr:MULTISPECIES: hypothetical protein [unclassified Pseudofrankia]MDT3442990.1 hypothetical protein [Pseudofrankia sp. BMG5.37]